MTDFLRSMTQTDRFDARLDLVPMSPGVYLMKDASGSVIYVGKAIHLRNRLRSYFTENPKGNAKVLAMISHIADFSYFVCDNELEALILECNLIKEYRPHYNILLRDDKEYPYLRVTLHEEYPRVLKSFRVGPDIREGAKYYGPYQSASLKNAIETLQALFPMKTCSRVLPRDIGKERPCLNYHIGKCAGPCKGDVSKEEYRQVIADICLFLEGRYDGIVKDLEREMKAASAQNEFEKAALYRDRVRALQGLMQKQIVCAAARGELDVVGLSGNGNELCVQKLEIRHGRLTGSSSFFAPESGETQAEILQTLLLQHYLEAPVVPREILIPIPLEEQSAFKAALSSVRKAAVSVRVPSRGYGRELLVMANNNAAAALRRHTLLLGGGRAAAQETLGRLSELVFGSKDRIRRIEAFDVSNYGQDDISASMVVFVDGKPVRSQYRLFKIRNQENQDDYSAMRQALARRLGHLGEEGFGETPDLILVDGGAGHISVAQSALSEAEKNIAVLGMVKDSRHRTRGLLFPDGGEIELSPEKTGGTLEREEKLALLRLISAVQEEAHRFAISYTKKIARKRNMKFSLDDIPGIGPSRRKQLLLAFKTLRGVGEASPEDLRRVHGMTEQAADAVYRHFHKDGPPENAT